VAARARRRASRYRLNFMEIRIAGGRGLGNRSS
jgi:hypothetical protein